MRKLILFTLLGAAFDTVPGGGHGGWPPEQNQRVQLDSLKFLQSVGVIR